MEEEKWSIDDLEAMYLMQYTQDDVTESAGDDVQDFLQWCRENLVRLN